MDALTVSVEPGVLAIDPREWDALVMPELEVTSPFLLSGFLGSLEAAGTLTQAAGWIPQILTVRRGSRLVAGAPAYVKLNSHGEFVFDFAFAQLAGRLGLAYYPKLLIGVPFTPASGRRLLTAPGEDRPALLELMGRNLVELAQEIRASSVHVNFARADEVAALKDLGFVERHGVQYHWVRRGAASFDDYLARFNSKRRNQLKREVRAAAEQGLRLECLRGEALRDSSILDTAFALYKSTVDKFYWGRQYLNREVFDHLAVRFAEHLEVVVAREGDDRIIAGAVNVASPRTLYGRYWGALEERPFLHFNVCYYRGIEECLSCGLDTFEPGAGGEHKLARGFDPTVTSSVHRFFDPRVSAIATRYIEEERAALGRELEALHGEH